MPRFDFASPRLFIEAALMEDTSVPLEREQAHYLRNVLRLEAGGTVLAFNGRDGEWHMVIEGTKAATMLRAIQPDTPAATGRRPLFIASRRSNMPGSIISCKRPSRWARPCSSRC